jgi:hypothetical protein
MQRRNGEIMSKLTQGHEVIITIDKIIEEDRKSGTQLLEKYAKENPAHMFVYIEYQNLIASRALNIVNLCALTLSYVVPGEVENKTNAKKD